MIPRYMVALLTPAALVLVTATAKGKARQFTKGAGLQLCQQAQDSYHQARDAALQGLVITAREMLDMATALLLEVSDYIEQAQAPDPMLEYTSACFGSTWKKVKELKGLLRVVTTEPGATGPRQTSRSPEDKPAGARIDHDL